MAPVISRERAASSLTGDLPRRRTGRSRQLGGIDPGERSQGARHGRRPGAFLTKADPLKLPAREGELHLLQRHLPAGNMAAGEATSAMRILA